MKWLKKIFVLMSSCNQKRVILNAFANGMNKMQAMVIALFSLYICLKKSIFLKNSKVNY